LSEIGGRRDARNVGTFAGKTATETGISPIFPFIINVLYPNGTRGASGRTKISSLKRNLTRFAERKSRPFEGSVVNVAVRTGDRRRLARRVERNLPRPVGRRA